MNIELKALDKSLKYTCWLILVFILEKFSIYMQITSNTGNFFIYHNFEMHHNKGITTVANRNMSSNTQK